MLPQEIPPEGLELIVEPDEVGQRLDWFLAQRCAGYSRAQLRRAINATSVKVDGERVKAAHRMKAGERVNVRLVDPPIEGPLAEEIPLELLYEDDLLAVVNKPPGMVVHPARGHWSGTLTSALQHHFERLSGVGGPTRPGIVHRLDRDTSGAIVVAKEDRAHWQLARQFQDRTVEKDYWAIVVGRPQLDRDFIDLPIGMHPHQREKMAIRPNDRTSRAAVSFYEVLERFDGFAVMRIAPRTGRTHQIRVHLASIGCPVLCDRQYGHRAAIARGEIARRPEDREILLDRQALHAWRLSFDHPRSGERLSIEAPLPEDLTRVLAELRVHRRL